MSSQKLHLVRDPNTTCGFECDPFSPNQCVLSLSDEYSGVEKACLSLPSSERRVVAQAFCREVGDKLLLRLRIEEQEELVRFLRERNTHLSTDPKTDMLTGMAISVLEEDLFSSGVMDSYREKNFELRYICLDVDNLRVHNAGPGKHEQGDMALSAVARKIKELFSRGVDITAMEHLHGDYVHDSHDAHASGRSNEAGDEFNVYTFLAPNEQKRSNDLQHAVARIEEAFMGFGYEYEGVFYPVSVSFAIADGPIPRDIDELKTVKKTADVAMMEFKKGRDKSTTAGVGVDLIKKLE